MVGGVRLILDAFFFAGFVMAVSGVVCGPDGASGVTYAMVGGAEVTCGVDSGGNTLALQVSTLGVGDVPVEGGEQVGLDIGGAVLLVMAAAFGFRLLGQMFRGHSGDC